MTSTKQIEANRANAKKSTGPVTDAGKKHSSRNATRHGLTSQDVFVPEGLAPEFDAFKADLKREIQPSTPLQMIFFNQALAASWKQIRCERSEAELAAKVGEPGMDPLSDPKLESTIRTIERARSQANRLLNNALTNLRVAKSAQRQSETPDLFAEYFKPTVITEEMQNEAISLAEEAPDPLLTPEVTAAIVQLQSNPKATTLDFPVLVDFMTKFRRRQDENEQTNPIVVSAAA
ncbi:MAG: hypothetical protein ABI693_34195 [Bryobacteraceae bacterium]